MYPKLSRCRICNNTQLTEVLDLGMQALTTVFLKKRAQQVTCGPLKLVKCTGDSDACGLLQLQHIYDPGELYGKHEYHWALNASRVAHLQGKARTILDRVKLPGNALIIDIGAHDGTILPAYQEIGCTLVGIDPWRAKCKRCCPPYVQPIPEFLSAAAVQRHVGGRKATVITSLSVFNALQAPLHFMKEIAAVLDDQGIWLLEQHYMPAMLQRNGSDTVCHEHLEYYALKQIQWMTDKVGLKIIDVEISDINGGSFCIMVAKQKSHHVAAAAVAQILDDEARAGLHTLTPYQVFGRRVAASRTTLRAFLDEAKRCGKSVSALGASPEGNVLLQYCQITPADIVQIGEVHPDKLQAFTPGTLIPIVAEADVLAQRPDYLLVLPWQLRNFFVEEPRFRNRNLLFPLPQLELVRPESSRPAAEARRLDPVVMRHTYGPHTWRHCI